MKPGTLMKFYDRVAMIICEATWDDIAKTYRMEDLSEDQIWTFKSRFKSGVIKYWIVLVEEQLYVVNGDVLKSLEAGGWVHEI
jgi:ribosomal protein S13